tara:strand:- start:87 stop:1076 length:990 start_codon:yes stop_codon:yes gene_type:complete
MKVLPKIYITGGAGYVGSMLSIYLAKKGYQVTVLDLFIYEKDIFKNYKNITTILGDIRDTKLLDKTLPTHDIVIHLACISNDPSFELNPQLGKSINLLSFEPLVKLAKKNNVKKFIYASSSSVYGISDEKNVHEEIILKPLTDYSKFKAECEQILLDYSSNEFCTTVIRPATVCGYSVRQRLDVVVNILTNLAYNKKEITVFGGEQLRPNIHIDDMVKAYELMIVTNKELINNKIYNVGYDNYPVMKIAEKVKKLIGDDVKVNSVPTDDNRSYHISSQKIKDELGFAPKKNINDAILDLKKAFNAGLLPDSLKDKKYFNIETMKNINLI